jgi:Do/DeqQ family serine protease
MASPRLLQVLVAFASLGAGLAIGARVGDRLERPAAAAAPAAAPLAAGSGAGPDFAAIARRATPAVVNISALQVYQTQRSPFFSDPFFREFFGRNSPYRIPLEERKTSLGSGVIVGSDGLIVTNNHVIEHARRIAVTTADGRRHRGELVAADPATDIAVVRIEGRGLPTLPWGDSSRASVGEYVLAIGNPFQLNQTVTMGIISATGRSNVGIVDYEDFIQTDAAINPGNSGGALVNTRAELIGVNTAIYSETGGYQGIGFAVPANLARKVVEELVRHGRVIRGYVGITQIRPVDEEAAVALGLKEARGAIVYELLRGSPADRAGLEPGDVIVSVGGEPIEDATRLRRALASAEVGKTLAFEIIRNGRKRELRIPVEEPPQQR